MQEESSSIIVAFISFVLSFLGSCEVPETLVTTPPAINDRQVEIVLAAPQLALSNDDRAATVQILEQRFAYLTAEVSMRDAGRFVLVLPSTSFEQQDVIFALASQQGRLHFHRGFLWLIGLS